MDKEIKQEFENLARMVKGEFDNVHQKFDSAHKEIQDLREEMHEQFRQLRFEIKQIWSKLEEIEQKLGRISQTSKEDADALAGDVFDLRQRVEFLESQIKKLQKA